LPGNFFNLNIDRGRPRDMKQNQPFISQGLAVIFLSIEVSSCEDPVGTKVQLDGSAIASLSAGVLA